MKSQATTRPRPVPRVAFHVPQVGQSVDVPAPDLGHRRDQAAPLPIADQGLVDVQLGGRLGDRHVLDAGDQHHSRPAPGRYRRRMADFVVGVERYERQYSRGLRPGKILAGDAGQTPVGPVHAVPVGGDTAACGRRVVGVLEMSWPPKSFLDSCEDCLRLAGAE